MLDGVVIYANALCRPIIWERDLSSTVAVQMVVYFVLKQQQHQQQNNVF